jgi:ParB family chromosome partitioning protein
MDSDRIAQLPLDLIHDPAAPVRTSMTDDGLDELAQSLAVEGLIQPITVYPSAGGYVLKDGSRRCRAARMLRWPTIAAIITAAPAADDAATSLIANVQREDMNPLDEARALAQLDIGRAMSARDLARRVGKSYAWVRARLDLLALSPRLKAAVEARALPLHHALALHEIPEPGWEEYYTQHVIEEGVNLATVQAWVAQAKSDINRQRLAGQPTTPPSEWEPPPEPLYPCWACTVPRPISHLRTQHVCLDCLKTIAAAAAGSAE